VSDAIVIDKALKLPLVGKRHRRGRHLPWYILWLIFSKAQESDREK
jgi:hypothetical protein